MSWGAFTPKQEARLREIVREELEALAPRRPLPDFPVSLGQPHDFNTKADEFIRRLRPWGEE